MGSYRAVLEVAKYCGPQDVLKHCREVSSVWAQAGLCNELWDLYSDTCGFPPRHSSESAFTAYVRGRTQGYKLALFVENEVVVYDCLTGLTERLRGYYTNHLSNWVIYLDKIICFGGCIGDYNDITALREAHMYEPNNPLQLQNMITPRFRHSGIVFQGKLYVFGGLDGHTTLDAAEQLNLKQWDSIAEEQWQSLPNSLHKRFDVSLCFDLKYIYICGQRSKVEQYCPQTNTYSKVCITADYLDIGIVMYGTELLLLSKTEVIRTDLKTQKVKTNSVSWKWKDFPEMNIVAVNQFLYRISARGIDRYNIETLTSDLVLDLVEIRRTAIRSGCGCCHRF